MNTETIKKAEKMAISFGEETRKKPNKFIQFIQKEKSTQKQKTKKEKFIEFLNKNKIIYSIDGTEIIFEKDIPQIDSNSHIKGGLWINFHSHNLSYHVRLDRNILIKKNGENIFQIGGNKHSKKKLSSVC